MKIEEYKNEFIAYMNEKVSVKEPINLYEPISYILNLGGKRLRPVMTLMGCDLFNGNYKEALDAALAIEMFHNFTLIHDDIMDEAPIRRGKTTVHHKWDLNTAILSGDAMMILAYQIFENYNGDTFKRIISLFNKTAIEVCEGQQLDIDFETRSDVKLSEYKKMICFKTAVLVGSALKMGAIIANVDEKQAELIYDFGLNLGMAFQLQDDFLDTFGNSEFGKKIGGDIIENKKTFLLIKLLEIASVEDQSIINKMLNLDSRDEDLKIQTITGLYTKYAIDQVIQKEIELYTVKAFSIINELNISDSNKNNLQTFGYSLMNRKL